MTASTVGLRPPALEWNDARADTESAIRSQNYNLGVTVSVSRFYNNFRCYILLMVGLASSLGLGLYC